MANADAPAHNDVLAGIIAAMSAAVVGVVRLTGSGRIIIMLGSQAVGRGCAVSACAALTCFVAGACLVVLAICSSTAVCLGTHWIDASAVAPNLAGCLAFGIIVFAGISVHVFAIDAGAKYAFLILAYS